MLAQIATEIHAPDLAVEGAGARLVASGDGDHNDDMRGAVHRHGEGGGGGGGLLLLVLLLLVLLLLLLLLLTKSYTTLLCLSVNILR